MSQNYPLIKIVVTPDMKSGEQGFAARCLNHDLACFGKTVAEAERSIKYLLAAYIGACQHENINPFEYVTPAPPAAYHAFHEARMHRMDKLEFHIQAIDGIQLPDIEIREYRAA
jgi:hypothetical protein